MNYIVRQTLKGQTKKGEIELKPGQVIKLSEDKAAPLLASGKITPFCYWMQTTVDDCQYPCFMIDEMRVIKECSHFSEYWGERVKELETK